MKLRTAQEPVERYGQAAPEKAFTIKATDKAFEILFSKIYKEKVAAIIRELSCNAYDAHVAVGKTDLPFRVTLPSGLCPNFIVRDFGPGLSPTQIKEVFTTFFESTKEDSNDYIGALGLGCKSPFSKVDAFVVNSYQNGTLQSYTMFKENGLPKTRPNTPKPVKTDEPDGLEVIVPVDEDDFWDYSQRAQTIYSWFSLKPEGFSTSERKRHYEHFTGKGKAKKLDWYITEQDYNIGHNEEISAVMGNVCYPIRDQRLDGEGWKLRSNYNRSFRPHLVINFEVGELDIQAGREDLSYDKATIKAINTKMKAIRAFAQHEIDAYFNKAETLLKAYLLYETAPPEIKTLYSLGKAHYKGADLTQGLMRMFHVGRHHAHEWDSRYDRQAPKTTPPVFLFVDTQAMNDQRTSLWKKAHPEGHGYIISSYGGQSKGACDPSQILAWKKLLEGEDVSLTSQFKVQRTKAKVRTLKKPLTAQYELGTDHRREIEIEVESQSGIFIELSSNKYVPLFPNPEDPEASAPSGQIFSLVKLCHKYLDDDLVLVPSTRLKPFREADNWTHAHLALYRLFREKIKDRAFVRDLWLAENLKLFGDDVLEPSTFRGVAEHCHPDHPIRQFYDFYMRCAEAYGRMNHWLTFLEYLGRKPRKRLKLRNLFRAMDKKFPLVYQSYRSVPYILLKELALYATVKLHMDEETTNNAVELELAA